MTVCIQVKNYFCITFTQKFQLPDKPICIARWRNKKGRHPTDPKEKVRHFVVSYLAKRLERNLYQVYRHFVAEYAFPVKGPYSAQEEKIMEICFYHCPDKAVVYLSAILSRDPRNIYNRLHYIHDGKFNLLILDNANWWRFVCKNCFITGKPGHTKTITWKLELATKFLLKLIKHSGYSLNELKNKTFDLSVWHKLQDDMSEPYYKLRRFWYYQLHVMLFVEYDVKFIKLGKKLMKM